MTRTTGKKSGGHESDAGTAEEGNLTSQEKVTFEAAYKKYLAQAGKLQPHEIVAFAGNAELVLGNVQRGVTAVVGLEGEVQNAEVVHKLGFKAEELRGAVTLAQAFSYSNLIIDRDVASDGSNAALYAEHVAPLRRKLLKTAEALVEAGLIPDAELVPIRPGHGPRDAAQDVVRLVALFKKHAAAIAGMHPIKAGDLALAEQKGSELWSRLNTDGAVKAKNLPAKVQADIDNRNRLWTLLLRTYQDLWKVGAVVWGWDVDEHVPALRAREAAKRTATGGGSDTTQPAAAPAKQAGEGK